VLLVVTLPVEILLVELVVAWDLVRWALIVVAVVGTLEERAPPSVESDA
jgi:hypothetical protein